MNKEPITLSIGGGKGGVGKSMVCSNLAVQYANAGFRVVLIDLDFGAANVHTIFGIRQPPKGLGDYFTTPRSQLTDYILDSNVEGLRIVPASGFVPELANLKHVVKAKLIRQIRHLDADLVLLDLGAGSANNVIDFFTMTHGGVVVTTPEPTSVLNAYEFLKNVIYRILFRMFRNHRDLLQIIRTSTVPNNAAGLSTVKDVIEEIEKRNPWVASCIREVCHDLNFFVVFNQAKQTTDAQLGVKLRNICEKYLSLPLNYSGMIYYNEEVPASVYKMSPISLVYPDSVTVKSLDRIGVHIFQELTHRMVHGESSEDFDTQLQRVTAQAKKDYVTNRLTQNRLHRKVS